MRSFLMIQGIVLQVIRNWFEINSKEFKYIKDDPLNSKIEVDMSFNWRSEVTQKRPGIYLKRDMYTPNARGTRSGLDDLRFSSPAGDDVYTFFTGSQMTVFAVGKYPGETEELATELTRLLVGMCPIIRQDFNLLTFDLQQVGGVQKTEEYKEMWVVPHVLSLSFVEDFPIGEIAPLVKAVTLKTKQELHR